MPLDRASARRARGSSRRWYRPALEPLPPEPGRLLVSALLGRARRARGCETPGDDRLETRAYAVKRYLFRLGHAQRSARFATSIGQLVAGLAPVMGWGTVPRDAAGRARFVRAHRRSVQRYEDAITSGRIAGGLIYVSDRADVLDAVRRAARRAGVPERRFRTRSLEDVQAEVRRLTVARRDRANPAELAGDATSSAREGRSPSPQRISTAKRLDAEGARG